MTMNPLPPQAYTKDTLIKAFQWIQLQPANLRDLASTPDVLVSLYLKAKLQGEAALDRPSIQNFKSELKNLAGQLGEFDTSKTTGPMLGGMAGVDGLQTQALATAAATHTSLSIGTDYKAPMNEIPVTPAAAHIPTAGLGQSFNFAPGSTPPGSTPPVSTPPAAQPIAPQATSFAPPATPSMQLPPLQQGTRMHTPRPQLDAKSQAMLEEIKLLANLESDTEALRMLISVGHKQLKNLLR